MNTERTPLNDKELWRSLAAAREDAPAVVSELDFAAWLEGRLPEKTAARYDAPWPASTACPTNEPIECANITSGRRHSSRSCFDTAQASSISACHPRWSAKCPLIPGTWFWPWPR